MDRKAQNDVTTTSTLNSRLLKTNMMKWVVPIVRRELKSTLKKKANNLPNKTKFKDVTLKTI